MSEQQVSSQEAKEALAALYNFIIEKLDSITDDPIESFELEQQLYELYLTVNEGLEILEKFEHIPDRMEKHTLQGNIPTNQPRNPRIYRK